MKIGILTFHNAYNYGAILQAFATQTLLESMGHSSEIINYNNNFVNYTYQKLHFKWKGSSTFKKFFFVWFYAKSILQKRKEERFELFKNKKLHISANCYSSGNEVDASLYDVILLGSDQIWNPTLTDGLDPVYFGQVKKGIGTKVISWSPSSSYIDYSDEELKQMALLLSNISCLSVREEELRKIVFNLTKRNVRVTLDPTLMLQSKVWLSLCHEVVERNYVLVYAVKNREATTNLAKIIAKKFNKRIIVIKASVRPEIHPYVRNTCSPTDFLSYIRYADYVVSSSFHGTAFAILFKKQFVNYVPKSTKDSRIVTILNNLGLNSRMANEEYNINNISSIIDYEEVNKRLDIMKSKSYDFLNQALFSK